MDSILFEKQEAALCAQHALNMLIQDQMFSVQELAEIAKKLDREENSMLDENSRNRESQNMNDSGFFSIQVISEALKAFDLVIHNIEHPSMAHFKKNPLSAKAFLCNHNEHWFVLRKFGSQWFELNSLNLGPKLLSDTFVGIFIHQLTAEGYSIFVVEGILPESEADQLITLCPVEQPITRKSPPKPQGTIQKFISSVGRRLGSSFEMDNKEECDLAIAMAMSMEDKDVVIDEETIAAIRESLKSAKGESSDEVKEVENADINLKKNVATPEENLKETPILQASSEESLLDKKEDSKNIEKPLTKAEQQRKDREAFLQRFEKKT